MHRAVVGWKSLAIRRSIRKRSSSLWLMGLPPASSIWILWKP